MTAEDIKEIIAAELRTETDIKSVFGLDLTQCLIEPVKQNYRDALDNSRVNIQWTVLEETSDTNGYKIYFDEDANMFGLGMKSDKNELIDIGYYGTFLETLYGM